MSDTGATLPVDVTINDGGSAAQFAQGVADAIEKVMRGASREIQRALMEAARNFSNARPFQDTMNSAIRDTKVYTSEINSLRANLEAVGSTARGVSATLGDTFDPRSLDAVQASLVKIIQLQADMASQEVFDPAKARQMSVMLEAVGKELTTTRTLAVQAARASTEAFTDSGRAQRQDSRLTIAQINADKARQTVASQTAASREVAATRAAAQQSVALTTAASRQRIAMFELVGRTIRSIERGLRTVFQGTATAMTTAFRTVGSTVTGVAQGIGSAFQRSTTRIRNDITNNNNAVSTSYRNSWRNNTRTVNNELREQGTAVRRFASETTQSLSSISLAGAGAIGAIAGLAGRALTGGFRRATTLEDAERALTTLLGSVEAARSLREEILQIVTGTPFKLDQFANAATQLTAFNIEAERIPKILTAIADAAAVRGGAAGETVDRLVRVFGQMQSAGRLMGDDVLQLSEAGIPALAILGNAMGETTASMRKLISKGLVPADEAMEILVDGIQNGTDGINGATVAFDGLAKALGTTLSGSVANFGAALDRLGANIIAKFQPLIVNIVQFATASIDAISSIVGSFGDAIAASPVFRQIDRLFDGLGARVKTLSVTLKPYMDSIARAMVAVGTALGALAVLRRLPGILGSVGVAFYRLLTPTRLLITGLIAFKAYFDNLRADSPELNETLTTLGRSLQRLAATILPPLLSLLSQVGTAISIVLEPAAAAFNTLVLSWLVPALQKLNTWLENSVTPAVERFAEFMSTRALPAVMRFTRQAIEFLTEKFQALVAFVRTSVLPVVGAGLEKAVEIGGAAFRKVYDFLSTKFVPFIRADLVPAMAGLAATLGALALGGPGLAGLAAAITGAVLVFRNDQLRGQIISFFQGIVENIREFFTNLFNARTIQNVVVGVMKVAKRIGEVLGDALSDRRLVTATAGIVAAGVAIAGSFIVGFGEGVIKNIPELADLLAGALFAAFKEVTSDPRLIAAAIGIFASVKFVAGLRNAGKQSALVFTEGLAGGFQRGAASLGGGSGFLNAMFGRRGALAAQLDTEMRKATQSMIRTAQQQQKVIQAATGRPVLGAAINTADGIRKINDAYKALPQVVGPAVTAGSQFRVGLQQINTGLRESGARMENFAGGMRLIGASLKTMGPEIASAAGAIAGGAFMASFVAQALFDAESSGGQKLQAGLGLLATSIGTGAMVGAQFGGAAGAAAGVGVGVFGALTAAIGQSSEATRKLNEQAKILGQTLADLDAEEVGAEIDKTVLQAFTDGTKEAREALAELNIDYQEFSARLQKGEGAEFIAEQFDRLGPSVAEFAEAVRTGEISLGRIDDAMKDPDWATVPQALRDAGIDVTGFRNAMSLLGETTKLVKQGFDEADLKNVITNTPANRIAHVREQVQLANDASKAFRDTLNELNQQQIDALQQRVDDARGALNEAELAAQRARDAVIEFLTGGAEGLSLEQATNQGIVNISSLAEQMNSTLVNEAGKTQQVVNANWALMAEQARSDIESILTTGDFTTREQAEAALAPLLEAAGGTGTLAGEEITNMINEVLDKFESPDFAEKLKLAEDAEAAVTDAQTALDSEENRLQARIELDPESIPALIAAAEQAGRDVDANFAYGISQNKGVPKTEAANMSRAAAIDAGKIDAWTTSGQNATRGFAGGITSVLQLARNAGAAVAAAAVAAANKTLNVESPSKVTHQIGIYFTEGLAEGVIDAMPEVLEAAATVANKMLAPLTNAGKAAAKAIGAGIAEEGGAFLGSIRSALDSALEVAMSRAQLFKAVGQEIASSLFQSQGQRPGLPALGGSAATALAMARNQIPVTVLQAAQNFARLVEALGPNARTFGGNQAGAINRNEFLSRGQDVREFIQLMLDSGVAVESAVKEGKAFRDQLVNVARGAGATTAQINAMLNTLGLTDAQLAAFVKQVNDTTKAVQAATTAEEAKRQAEEKAAAAAAAAEAAVAAGGTAADRQSLPGVAFRDLIVNTPSHDPAAVALYTANQVALKIG